MARAGLVWWSVGMMFLGANELNVFFRLLLIANVELLEYRCDIKQNEAGDWKFMVQSFLLSIFKLRLLHQIFALKDTVYMSTTKTSHQRSDQICYHLSVNSTYHSKGARNWLKS